MSIIWPNVCFGQLSGQIPLQGEVSKAEVATSADLRPWSFAVASWNDCFRLGYRHRRLETERLQAQVRDIN